MVGLDDLLLFTNKNNELSFDKKVNQRENIISSEHSFEEVLKNCQKDNGKFQNPAVQNNYEEKHKEKAEVFDNSSTKTKIQKPENDDTSISDKESKELTLEWLFSLLSGQLENSSIFGDSNIKILKVIAPSLQKVMTKNSISSSEGVIEALNNILESLYSTKIETDKGKTSMIGNFVETEMLYPMETNGEGTDVISTNNEHNFTASVENAQYLDVLLEKQLPYNSSIKQILNKIYQYSKPEPRQIMSAMETAGLGNKALITFINDKAVDEYMNSAEYQFKNFDFNILDEIEDGTTIVQNSGENNHDYNLSESGFSRQEILDVSLIEPVKTNTGAELLDITKMLDNNNPADSIEVIRQLAEKISMSLKNNRYEIELQVKPEHLGRLILKVTLEDGVLAGKIFTTNHQTGEILQSHLNDLRNALEEQGYSFSQLDVNVGSEENAQYQQSNRERLNAGDIKTAINSFDSSDELKLIKKEIKPKKSYMVSNAIDYFA